MLVSGTPVWANWLLGKIQVWADIIYMQQICGIVQLPFDAASIRTPFSWSGLGSCKKVLPVSLQLGIAGIGEAREAGSACKGSKAGVKRSH